ncbi:MAG: hypothetical protein FWB77_02680 [Treponema sp.]|nr:hypothetical protein [Treponema sp.]
MKNKKVWLGIQVIVLVFGMMAIGCGGEENNNSGGDEYIPPAEKDPLTGTVTITNDIEVAGDYAQEEMTLIADISDLNGVATHNSYQWKRNDVNISGANESTYEVTSDDIGKIISVHVTNWEFSGEKSGEYTVSDMTMLNLTLKLDHRAGVINPRIRIWVERESGAIWNSILFPITTSKEDEITLHSWQETKFKMYTILDEGKYYFKKGYSENEWFEYSSGSKTYVFYFFGGDPENYTGFRATEE